MIGARVSIISAYRATVLEPSPSLFVVLRTIIGRFCEYDDWREETGNKAISNQKIFTGFPLHFYPLAPRKHAQMRGGDRR